MMLKEQTISTFCDCFGAPPQVLVQVPGRINLMGRHVDHQGGDVNLLTIDRHIFLAARRNGGDTFRFRNLKREKYPDFDFKLADLHFDSSAEWRTQISDPQVVEWRASTPLWTRYPVGAILRLYRQFDAPLTGMDVAVHGNLPGAAGLSSSSALTLGFVLAANTIFGWKMGREQLINTTGEAEWFTGVIGGACAPAAMMSCALGRVVRIGFFPFQVKGDHHFPDDLRIVLANSQDAAVKGEGARDEYNWRVACYRLADVLLRRARSDWFSRVQHLRDLDPQLLGVPLAEIYGSMVELPERITGAQLTHEYPEAAEQLQPVFAGHTEPESGYPVRDILLYGLGEMARSSRLGALLDRRDYPSVGAWLTHSHDGDRVSKRVNGKRRAWRPPVLSDQFLGQLADAAEAGAPSADLTRQSGWYGASTFNIDEMVDLCHEVDGCLGAQIIGAGLGGCMIAVVHASAAEDVISHLKTAYFEPNGLPSDVWSMLPSHNARVERL